MCLGGKSKAAQKDIKFLLHPEKGEAAHCVFIWRAGQRTININALGKEGVFKAPC